MKNKTVDTSNKKIRGWTKEDTEAVLDYKKKIDSGEIKPIPIPKGLSKKGLRKLLLGDSKNEDKKVKTNINEFSGNGIDQFLLLKSSLRKVSVEIIKYKGYVGFSPQERTTWSEKDTQAVKDAMERKPGMLPINDETGKRYTPEEYAIRKERVKEYYSNQHLKALFQIPRVMELMGLEHGDDEKAYQKDLAELYKIEEPYFALIKKQFQKGQIKYMPIRPSEDLANMLFGKNNYKFVVEE